MEIPIEQLLQIKEICENYGREINKSNNAIFLANQTIISETQNQKEIQVKSDKIGAMMKIVAPDWLERLDKLYAED